MSSDLTISTVPAAFSAIGEKHNALVELIRAIKGVGGVKVTVSDTNILIEGAGGSAVNAVMSDGTLGAVVGHSTYSATSNYPTVLKVVNGSSSVLINSSGVTITTTGGNTCTIAFSAITANMTVREIDVCDGGTAKKMLIIGSAPY